MDLNIRRRRSKTGRKTHAESRIFTEKTGECGMLFNFPPPPFPKKFFTFPAALSLSSLPFPILNSRY
ncbi:unnamed protein product [Citrullus colocynthis]|uniref:Uncharacterized protein n=1 Tax=Citrullus colocynthis TaxID=252529 RepID=A0ABP0ZCH3_9ROSI